MRQSQKILIIGPSWVGDMIMAQSLFKLIKQQDPSAVIDLLAPKWTTLLAEKMEEINERIILPIGHGELALGKRYKIAKRLRAEHYTKAIVLPNSFKSALIPFWAKIPERVGWRGESRWGLLNDIRYLDKKKYPLLLQRYAALGLKKDEDLPEKLMWPSLIVNAAEREKRARDKILVLCPGAEFGPAKRWPADYYAEVARKKHEEGWHVWLLGGPNDRDIAGEIQKQTNNACINFVGKTSIVEAIDLVSCARVVVTNDSGLMHIAAAVDCPQIVAIYGPTSTEFTPPLSNKANVLSTDIDCRPCFKRICPLKHHKCMQDIKPEMVLRAMNR